MSDASDLKSLEILCPPDRIAILQDNLLSSTTLKNVENFNEPTLAKLLQNEYWWKGNNKVPTGSDPHSNLKSKWLSVAPGARRAENRLELTEYQVVRECLWALIGAEKSFLFISYTNSEILTKNLCLYTRKPAALTHLTYGALDAFCIEVSEAATNVLQIRAFLNFVLFSGHSIPLPFIPLAQVCQKLKGDVFQAVSELEQACKLNGSSRLTLISLSNKLQIWYRRLSFMSTLILQVCSPHLKTVLSGETSILLLNRIEVLSRTISKAFPDSYMIDLIGEVFVSSTESYLRNIMGKSNLSNTPFLRYAEDVTPSDPNFWKSGVTLIKSSVPHVLSPVIQSVFIGAKSLSLLRAISSAVRNQNLCSAVEDHLDLFSISDKNDNSKGDADSGVEELEYHDDPDVQDLIKFMESTVLERPKYVLLETQSKKATTSPEKRVKYLRELVKIHSSRISSHLVSSLLHGPLSKPGTWLSAISCFADDLNLIHTFENLSKVVFFRSGEWMYAFCEDVFCLSPVNRTEAAVNKALKDQVITICGERSWLCDKIGLILSENDISLRINIPWPLNIVISEEYSLAYCNVFRFLFELKRAKWALDNAKWILMASNHKMALLRSRYLYVINGLHAFIADHIEVAHREFMKSLNTSGIEDSLDNVLSCFKDYVTRVNEICLLSDSASQKMLNQSLRELFGLCGRFLFPCEMEVEEMASEFSTRVGFLRTVLAEALQGTGCVCVEASSLLRTLEDSSRFNTAVTTRLHF